MQVVGEKTLNRAGVRVGVQMKRVAVERTPGGFVQAVGIRTKSGEGTTSARKSW